MSALIQYVPLHLIHQVWDKVEGFLSSALEHSKTDEYNVAQLKVLVAQGGQELYVAVDEAGAIIGAATVNLVNHPNCRTAFVTTTGGRIITGQNEWAQFVTLLKAHGATRCAAAGRKSVVRLLRHRQFKEKHVVVEVTL
jgi:hypothetical protein